MLVDDEPALLRAFSRQLTAAGFEVEAFDQGTAALARLERGGVGVIVSDISMPGLSGMELLRAVRENDRDLPVVLVTGMPTLRMSGDLRMRGRAVAVAVVTSAVVSAARLRSTSRRWAISATMRATP